MSLAGSAQMVALRRAAPYSLGCFLPLALAAPLLERGVVLLACLRSPVEEKLGNTASGERPSCCLSRYVSHQCQVLDEFASGRLDDTASVVPSRTPGDGLDELHKCWRIDG